MKKEGALIVVVAVMLLAAGTYIVFTQFSSEPQLSPGNGSSEPIGFSAADYLSVPRTCSDAEINSLWSQVFYESSEGIIILSNSSRSDICTSYLAYKNVSTGTYVLFGYYNNATFWDPKNNTQVGAIYANATPQGYDLLRNITRVDNTGIVQFGLVVTFMSQSENLSFAHEVSSADAAFREYDKIYKIKNLSAFTLPYAEGEYYEYTYNHSQSSDVVTHGGLVFNKNLTVMLAYSLESSSSLVCAPNWTVFNSSCKTDETQINYYVDTNLCSNETGRPQNFTSPCDYNHNGLIGNESQIHSDFTPTLYIDGTRFNDSVTYNQTRKLEIREGSLARVSFVRDFSTPLTLSSIEIDIQSSSSDFGYMIIKGLNTRKNITINRKNANASQVCIEDREDISSISSISDDCGATNEHLLNCPGTSANYTCAITNNTFVITGLMHSAVREYVSESDSPNPDDSDDDTTTCATNWTCSAWGTCANNQQSRTCTDSNNCNVTLNRPNITQSCTPPAPSCTSNWNCTNWAPDPCPKSGNQTRTCVDLSNCSTATAKPAEKQECTLKKSNILIIVILGIVLVGILGLVGVLIYFLNHQKGSEEQPAANGSSWPPAA